MTKKDSKISSEIPRVLRTCAFACSFPLDPQKFDYGFAFAQDDRQGVILRDTVSPYRKQTPLLPLFLLPM